MPIISNQFKSPLALSSSLDGIIGITINGITGNDHTGWSVASIGDVNGDGIDDVAIGAYSVSFGTGSTYLVFGYRGANSSPVSLLNLTGSRGVVINGIVPGDWSGYSVAGAGDVNGDGIDDVMIGAPGTSPEGIASAGSTYLIFGHTGSWDSSLSLSSLNGSNGVIIKGIAAGEESGISVAGAGDVNGDGFDDIVIGAYGASPGNFSHAGTAYLIFGHAGFWNSSLSLSSLNGSNGVVIKGIAAGDESGRAVASAGDVNGDGIADMVVGSPYAFPGNIRYAGSTYLIFGHTGAWSNPLLPLSLNGSNGVVINGIADGWSGISLAGVGDVNGDGLDDLAIGAAGSSPGGLYQAGATYLIFGHTGVWSSPLSLSSLYGTNGVVINGVAAGDKSGISLAGVGDVNGDGIGDMVIGAPYASPGGLVQAGSTYLIFGHTGAWSSQLSLSSLYGTNGVVINGAAAGDQSGNSVAGAGDINGDGFDDIVTGSPYASPMGLAQVGSTYLIFGDSLELLTNALTITQGQTVFLNNGMLEAMHPRNLAINGSIPFSISNVVHGAFSKLNFLQNELSQSSISFTHDNSIYAPGFEVTIGNWATIGPIAATISFDVPPALYVNPFSVGQGQTVALTNQDIRATSVYYPSDALIFSVSNVLHGNFIRANSAIIENQFNQSLLKQGQIVFATDGSASTPSYDITVSDGRITTSAVQGIVYFNAAPILLNNQLTLTPGQEKVILSSNDLRASDTSISSEELIFTPSTFNCHFENINLPGTALHSFLQGNVQGGQVLFVWDGHNLPSYNMSVSDNVLWTGPEAALIRLNTPTVNTFTTIESSNTVRNAIIGGTVSGIISLCFLALRCYLGKRMNGTLKNILVVENSTVEQEQEEWKRETLSPVVKEIFNKFKTTGFIGYRNEANTKAYVQCVELILLEIQKQGVEVHFPKLSITERIRLLTAIVDEIKIQLVKPSGFGGFIKPAFTADELKVAAPAIAKVVAMTVNKEKAADRIRHSVVERPKIESSAYPVMVRDNEIELEAVDGEQKFSPEAANQNFIDQPFETRMAVIEGHFAKFEERFSKAEEYSARSELRFTDIESSLKELLGHQLGANEHEQSKIRAVN